MYNCDDLNLPIKLEMEELIIKDEFVEDFTIKEEDLTEEQDPLVASKYNDEIPIDYCDDLNLPEVDEMKMEQDVCFVSKSDSDPTTYHVGDTSNNKIEVCKFEVENKQPTKVSILNYELQVKLNDEHNSLELCECCKCGESLPRKSLVQKVMVFQKCSRCKHVIVNWFPFC